MFYVVLFKEPSLASEVKVKMLYSGVIKGKVTDYHPSIFKNHSPTIIRAVTINPWAGHLYLNKNDPNKNAGGNISPFPANVHHSM